MSEYELSTDELLAKFMNACSRAGTSNSGLVISFSAGDDLAYAYYLRGVVEARIDRAIPPIKPGLQVRPKGGGNIVPSSSNGWKCDLSPRKLPKILTVKTVYYLGRNRWELVFKEETEASCRTESEYAEDGGRSWFVPLRFRAEDFKVLEVPTPAGVK